MRAVRDGAIFLVEKNERGAWVIYGTEGVRQYVGYTKAAAMEEYRKSYREVYNHDRQKGAD